MENSNHIYLGYSLLANRPQEIAIKYNTLLKYLGAEGMVEQFERFLNDTEFADFIETIEGNLLENNININIMENTIENNRLIAEFMGAKHINEGENYHSFFILDKSLFSYDEIKFGSNWEWLMKVVKAIEAKGYVVNIKGISCNIYPLLKEERKDYISSFVCGDLSKKIDIVYSACIGFIKWYNQQQK